MYGGVDARHLSSGCAAAGDLGQVDAGAPGLISCIELLRKATVFLNSQTKWRWEQIDPNRTGASGDLSKMFKNEPVKVPGVLGVSAPAPEAALLVREVVQNSWDAALESRGEFPDPDGPPFEVCFTFKSCTNERRSKLVDHLGLQELSERASAVGDRRTLGLTDDDCLLHLDDEDELRLLEISEQAGGGMYGPWRGNDSKLWMALCSIGITTGVMGRGGSYGYGKAGLIRGSQVRLVIAYTCFRERDEDPGATRRLLGMTYWDGHKIGGTSYTGSARFGVGDSDETANPLENEEADRLAEQLGMDVRDPTVPADLGTTLLLVEPTVNARDLVTAAERYWWPALQEPALHFHLQVVDEGGEIHHPRPKSNPDLRPFIDAYEAATTPQDNRRAEVRQRPIRRIGDYANPGVLGMRAEKAGWSYPAHVEADDGVDHRSLVALVRMPRMVVEYYEAGQAQPFVRGTFVADKSINEALRRTEPKAHDAWQTVSAAGDVPESYATLARDLLASIKRHVNVFRQDLKPTPRPAEHLHLPEFDRVMRSLLGGGGSGKRPPPSEQRPFSISPGGDLEAVAGGRLRLTGAATVEFSEHHEVGSTEGDEVEVRVSYRFMEDDRPSDSAELEVEPPPGFTRVPGRSDSFRGRLRAGSAARFEYLSEEYDPSWTGKLLVNAELVRREATAHGGTTSDPGGDPP